MKRNQYQKLDQDQLEEAAVKQIDAILASDEELVPSSGFLAAVMERVQEEAKAPAPIPFPWRLAIPGIVLTCGVFGLGGVELARLGVAAAREGALSMPRIPLELTRALQQTGSVALALGIALASWVLALRMAARSGLS